MKAMNRIEKRAYWLLCVATVAIAWGLGAPIWVVVAVSGVALVGYDLLTHGAAYNR